MDWSAWREKMRLSTPEFSCEFQSGPTILAKRGGTGTPEPSTNNNGSWSEEAQVERQKIYNATGSPEDRDAPAPPVRGLGTIGSRSA